MNDTKNIDTVLAIPADTQSGSSVGLMPRGWTSYDGINHEQSKGQTVLWNQWLECWEEVARLKKEMGKKTRLIICHNGDARDGNHHGTVQIVTKNLDEQNRMHIACMLRGMDIAGFDHRKGDMLRYISGTEVHVGYGEDQIARDFTDPRTGKYIVDPVIPPTAAAEFKDGRFVRHHWRPKINGVLFNIAHQMLGVGSRAWTKANSIRLSMMSLYFDCLNHGREIPRYVVSSHLHNYTTAEYEDEHGSIRGFVTPAFQLKTTFGFKVAALKLNSIGMLIFRITGDGWSDYHCPRVTFDETEVEVL